MKNRYYAFWVLWTTINFFMCCYYYDETQLKELFVACGILNIFSLFIWIYIWFNEKMELK